MTYDKPCFSCGESVEGIVDAKREKALEIIQRIDDLCVSRGGHFALWHIRKLLASLKNLLEED